MKIKLIVVDNYYEYDDYNRTLSHGISDWEEVSEEDVTFIRNNLWRIKSEYGSLALVIQDDRPVEERIKDIKATILKAQKEEERRKEAEKKRKEEAAAKREEKKILKNKAALKRLLESNPELVQQVLGA